MNQSVSFSSDPSHFDIPMIHRFLTASYWADGRTLEEVQTTIQHSLCFGLFVDDRQAGFARVVSDHVVFAYVMDVFVLPEFRGRGYASRLMQHMISSPELAQVTTWLLKTRDAYPLYEKLGFDPLDDAEWFMQLRRNST